MYRSHMTGTSKVNEVQGTPHHSYSGEPNTKPELTHRRYGRGQWHSKYISVPWTLSICSIWGINNGEGVGHCSGKQYDDHLNIQGFPPPTPKHSANRGVEISGVHVRTVGVVLGYHVGATWPTTRSIQDHSAHIHRRRGHIQVKSACIIQS